jgi:hypothetical protein
MKKTILIIISILALSLLKVTLFPPDVIAELPVITSKQVAPVQNNQKVTNKDIVFSNITIKESSIFKNIIGEATNNSNKECKDVTARITFYNQNGSIIDSSDILIAKIPSHGKIVWSTMVEQFKETKYTYKIQVETIID